MSNMVHKLLARKIIINSDVNRFDEGGTHPGDFRGMPIIKWKTLFLGPIYRLL
jgi:hypothetical protein